MPFYLFCAVLKYYIYDCNQMLYHHYIFILSNAVYYIIYFKYDMSVLVPSKP